MNNDKNIFGYIGSGISWILTGLQTNQIFEYINLCLSILISVITLSITIYSVVKKAKENKKIEKEDLEQIKKDVENIQDVFKEGGKDNGNK